MGTVKGIGMVLATLAVIIGGAVSSQSPEGSDTRITFAVIALAGLAFGAGIMLGWAEEKR